MRKNLSRYSGIELCLSLLSLRSLVIASFPRPSPFHRLSLRPHATALSTPLASVLDSGAQRPRCPSGPQKASPLPRGHSRGLAPARWATSTQFVSSRSGFVLGPIHSEVPKEQIPPSLSQRTRGMPLRGNPPNRRTCAPHMPTLRRDKAQTSDKWGPSTIARTTLRTPALHRNPAVPGGDTGLRETP